MKQNDIAIQERDFYLCCAWQKIIDLPVDELAKELGDTESLTTAKDYFSNLTSENYQNPKIIANQIAAFCNRSEHKSFNKILKEFYQTLDPDAIPDPLKTKKDPGEDAEASPPSERNITNEARDICQEIEKWAKQEQDNNQSEQNDSDSN